MAYGLLLLRGVVGLTMAGHGMQKLFGWFGGPGRTGTAQMFAGLGFPAAGAMAVAAGLAETGGVLFAFGLLTPLAALGIAVVMLNAIGSVHWEKGFWNMAGGYEYPLVLLTAAVSVAAISPGRFSLDRLIGWDGSTSGLWWGLGVLALAMLVSSLTLATRRATKPTLKQAPQRREESRRAA